MKVSLFSGGAASKGGMEVFYFARWTSRKEGVQFFQEVVTLIEAMTKLLIETSVETKLQEETSGMIWVKVAC